jgi:hypothetical protein
MPFLHLIGYFVIMKTRIHLLLVFAYFVSSLSAKKSEISYNRDIRPILSNHCFSCHGLDEEHRKAKLRLDLREEAIISRDGIRAIAPGSIEDSESWMRIISDDDDDVMPPPETHKSLTSEEKELVKQWIEEGAPYEGHWAFSTPKKAEVPKINGTKNPIDAFIQDRLKQEGLTVSPSAEKETLLRRVYLDLTGLPPTLEELDAFITDQSPNAWEKVIDDLMNRTAYGEHMARFWLDLARYADTHGLHLDNERSMWLYRDWVVKAFNQNLPFDEFTRWQLAGDLLPNRTIDQQIASGFNRCNVTTGEGGSIAEEWIYRYAVDRTSTAVEVWMGLTAGCATCHDHKFDPLSTKEYYSMYSFFHSAADPAMDGNKLDTPPVIQVPTKEQKAHLSKLDKQIAEARKNFNQALSKFKYEDPADQNPKPKPEISKTIWFEDDFPEGELVTAGDVKFTIQSEGPVFSGNKSLTRTVKNKVGQDVLTEAKNLTIPRNGTFFVHCFLDPENPPEAIMLQFYVNGWNHRAVWGDHEKIGWGKEGTHQRVVMGKLPQTGKWVQLQFPAARIGLSPKTKVTGFALTQFSGTVNWDHLGISSTIDKPNDPHYSWSAWKKQPENQRNKDLDKVLQRRLKGKDPQKWNSRDEKDAFTYWQNNVYRDFPKHLTALKQKKDEIDKKKEALNKEIPSTFVMADLPKARESFVMVRGQYDNPGEKVSRGVPAFLPDLPSRPKERDYNRLDLANWLVREDHPLTSRVIVNRIWQQFFGTGLVKTSSDFGTQGDLPSHPELLDWLAVQFMEEKWDFRVFIKRILTSRTYQQSSKVSPSLLKKDPDNRFLARGPRYRLDAEIVRDQALHLSGLLVGKVGGRGVMPYQPPNIWEPVGFGNSNTRYYKQGTGDDLYRRSLYTFYKRTAPAPFMSTFDAPNREQSCSGRGKSNTPMQALQLLNDIQHVEAARNFAEKIIKKGGNQDQAKISWAWRTATSRKPNQEEIEIVNDVLNQNRKRYSEDQEAAENLIGFGESEPDANIQPPELASWTLTANMILNLDEVVNKN